jgi:hypothetical protein
VLDAHRQFDIYDKLVTVLDSESYVADLDDVHWIFVYLGSNLTDLAGL